MFFFELTILKALAPLIFYIFANLTGT